MADELRYPAGWVPSMAPGPDEDEGEDVEEAAHECDNCGAVRPESEMAQGMVPGMWLCADCQ